MARGRTLKSALLYRGNSKMEQVILGTDVGTHGIRIVAVDRQRLNPIGEVNCFYTRDSSITTQELDAEVVWNTYLDALQEIAKMLSGNGKVLGIGITHQRGTIVPVDSKGKALALAMCDSDGRALHAADLRRYGMTEADYYQTSGCPFVSFNGLTKILWCKEYKKELFQSAASWLSLQDYLMSRLVGRLVVSEGSLLRNGCYNIIGRKIAKELLAKMGIPFEGEIIPLGTSAGAIEGYEQCSPCLLGAQVFAVPGDQPTAVIGSGSLKEQEIALNLGTSFVASLYNSKVCLDPEGMATVEILMDNRTTVEFGTGAGGQFMDLVARWLLGKMPKNEQEWDILDKLALEVPPGALGLRVVPLLWQVTSPNVMGRIENINAVHERPHVIRSTYEGLAFEALSSIKKVEKVTAKEVESVKVFGGMTLSSAFLAVLASVLDKTVKVSSMRQASAFGAALLVAVALGDILLQDASMLADTPKKIYMPNEEEVGYYAEAFQQYVVRR